MANFTANVVVNQQILDLFNDLPDIAVRVTGAAAYQEGNRVLAASQDVVPVDEGVLKASGTVTLPKKTPEGVEVIIAYGGAASEYALIQHETPPSVFKHNEGQTWKYLERPFNENVEGIESRLANSIQRGLQAEFPT